MSENDVAKHRLFFGAREGMKGSLGAPAYCIHRFADTDEEGRLTHRFGDAPFGGANGQVSRAVGQRE